jgi:AcrR family transcriptional regulator
LFLWQKSEQMQETPRKGSDTRERILDVAEGAVLEKGFAATSIEEVIAAVGITKSGFFYHFKDKNELAKACSSATWSARTRYSTNCSPVPMSSTRIRCTAFLSGSG